MKQSFSSLWARLVAPKPQDQRGIALLLTLGILSLLLVLAMSFAYSTRTERMAAGNNADLVKARLLAESGLERAMAILRYSVTSTATDVAKTYYPGNNSAFFYSPTSSTSAWYGRHYMFSQDTSENDTNGIAAGLAANYKFVPSSTSEGSTICVQTPSDSSLGATWIHVYTPTSAAEPTPKLAGRFAYVVIDQGGMIDPGAVVSTSTDETTVVPRFGANPAEIQLGNLSATPTASSAITNGTANAFRDRAAGVDCWMPTGKRWFSLAHMAGSRILNYTAVGNRGEQWKVFTQALFPWSYDKDTYRLTPTSTDAQARYNLANTSSDFSKLSDSSTATNPIPWLTSLTDSSGTSVREQVAANLVDYCDGDSLPTSNYAAATNDWPVNSAGTAPTFTYCGLEKVPYINEVSVLGVMTYDSTANQTIFNVQIDAELINQYESAVTASSYSLEVDVAWNNIPSSATTDDATNASYNGARFVMSVPAISANNYTAANALQKQFKYSWSGSSDVKIKSVYGVLKNSAGNMVDVAKIAGSSSGVTFNTGTNVIDFQVNDPRVNTESSQWYEGSSNFGIKNNPNMKNTSSPSKQDIESDDDPANASTAHVANTAMTSLWELGAIHRGEPWCTLNLAKYNTSTTATSTGVGGKYDGGDANILDQVKLSDSSTSSAPIRGRFNANSPQTEAWACFLAGVTIGGTYASPGSGTELTNANGNSLASGTNGIFKVNGADRSVSGNVPFTNRGGIALCTEWTNTDSTIISPKPTTDRIREEIIGKIAGLLTVRSNYFTVIVTAQAVKDTGGVDAAGGVQYATGKYCQVLAEQKILAVVSRDAFTDDFVIESFEYLNE